MNLQTPVKDASQLYKRYVSRLEKLGINTVVDFLYHVPFRYENYSLISKIDHLQEGEIVTIQGTVVSIQNQYTRKWKTLQKAVVNDGTGQVEIIWFNQPYLTKAIHQGDRISLAGKVKTFNNNLTLESADYEILYKETQPIHTGRLVPVYPETKGVSSKWLRRQIFKILVEQKTAIADYCPETIRIKNNLLTLRDALELVHFPETLETANKARERLAFDELFIIQLSSLVRRDKWGKNLVGNPLSIAEFKKNIEEFWKKLPFELTNAQKKAVSEIFADLAGKKPMNRLLEGDVGSGKTVVSAIAMYLTHLNGYQSVFMAPTEILANQHYETISDLLSPFNVRVDLVTGSRKWKMENGKWKMEILIGTHAVLSQGIKFDKLGLVVIDEQQRFGVEQRSIIRHKGNNPHLLTMTATPIPRTVALTLYGDLDLSYLDEMPKGRKLVKTWLVPPEKRKAAYVWIENNIKEQSSQAFIICPFIEESETMQTVKAATKEFKHLQGLFPNLRLGLLHGKLKVKEKDAVLSEFRQEKYHILVATPVVEVGIDIQNATIIVIEASERFGLSQLHQLRGRVGRGDKQSYCLLFTESKNQQTITRLKSLETIHVGAKLAELDLQLRGAGDIYGTAQHGKNKLKIASFSDLPLIEKTRKVAERLFPNLKTYPLLEKKLKTVNIDQVSPD